MNTQHPRLAREKRTLAIMIDMYCLNTHRQKTICTNCQELLAYAGERLEKCPFQAGKTTCAKCKVHCYTKEMRETIRVVMRYSGPRMFLRYPILTICHLIDGLRQEPTKVKHGI